MYAESDRFAATLARDLRQAVAAHVVADVAARGGRGVVHLFRRSTRHDVAILVAPFAEWRDGHILARRVLQVLGHGVGDFAQVRIGDVRTDVRVQPILVGSIGLNVYGRLSRGSRELLGALHSRVELVSSVKP